jgi:hypothetical protein
MSTIVTRAGKGSPLTHTEVDNNFTNLNTDKYQSGDNASFGSLSASGAFSANGGATLGDASGDALTINSSAVSVPNGLNFDSNTLVIDSTNNKVGVGTSTPDSYGSLFVVNRSQTDGVADLMTLRDGSAGTTFNFQTYADPAAGTVNRLGWGGAYLAFRNSTTERMRITDSGTVILQGGSTSATGVGITFPATQSASADANTLDDYEEGSFTPTFNGVTLGNGTVFGSYTKIGKVVTFRVVLLFGSTTSISTLTSISGLPFTAQTFGSNTYTPFVGTIWDSGTGWYGLTGAMPTSGVSISFPQLTSGAGSVTSTVPITFTTNDSINMGGSYIAA